MMRSVGNGGWVEVACGGQNEDDGKQLPSEDADKIRVLHVEPYNGTSNDATRRRNI
jgi:hypothetical protein